MPIPKDYVERVYAGVLGKLIGVYSGRPFEGWSHERIAEELGEVDYFVNESLGFPLIVTDDDIAGTFTFLRALSDYGAAELNAERIGHTWLNYILENRTTLWWGGMGNSTEHTAFLRLKQGIKAPQSGSIALDGKVLAEQIGAQIFIDGWAMLSPGNPEQAVAFAEKAASVSHDGVAVHAAMFLAAMEAKAFVEDDMATIIEVGLRFVPKGSLIRELVERIWGWHEVDGDWRTTRARIAQHYGYDRYGGNCHVIPNHAIILLSLLYGEDNFQKALTIANTSGWDTDCNAGNVACLMGIKQGLAAFEGGPDWRGPIADRLYLPSADGGRAITDAVTEATRIVNLGLALTGQKLKSFKNGARFHFELPGSVQAFQAEAGSSSVRLENVRGFSASGVRSLAIHCDGKTPARIFTPTFIPPEAITMPGYELLASPTLYPGQTVKAGLSAALEQRALQCRLYIQIYGSQDQLEAINGPATPVQAGKEVTLEWTIPDTGGAPVVSIGLALESAGELKGTVYLNYLTWDGEPNVRLGRPAGAGIMWQRAWVDAVDHYGKHWPEAYRISQNHGRGLLIQGTREWRNYRVASTISLQAVRAGGIAARVQGLRRYYALLLRERDEAVLVRYLEAEEVLCRAAFCWDFGEAYSLALEVCDERVTAWIDGEQVFEATDSETPLDAGGIALICEEGTLSTNEVVLSPLGRS